MERGRGTDLKWGGGTCPPPPVRPLFEMLEKGLRLDVFLIFKYFGEKSPHSKNVRYFKGNSLSQGFVL